jgi:glycosyltransferase involved in cell wall biosynthesis
MLGGGSLSSKVMAMIHSAGLIERVHFPGQVGQDALPAYYQAADLYISTSHSDGTSVSLLEALACGTPVLLRDIPGNRPWVEAPGEVGWLFSGVDGLADGIRCALQARPELPRMGRSARALAEARGDWGKNFPHLRRAWQIALAA